MQCQHDTVMSLCKPRQLVDCLARQLTDSALTKDKLCLPHCP